MRVGLVLLKNGRVGRLKIRVRDYDRLAATLSSARRTRAMPHPRVHTNISACLSKPPRLRRKIDVSNILIFAQCHREYENATASAIITRTKCYGDTPLLKHPIPRHSILPHAPHVQFNTDPRRIRQYNIPILDD